MGGVAPKVPVVFCLLVDIDVESFPVGQESNIVVLVSFDPLEFASDGKCLDPATDILQHVKRWLFCFQRPVPCCLIFCTLSIEADGDGSMGHFVVCTQFLEED